VISRAVPQHEESAGYPGCSLPYLYQENVGRRCRGAALRRVLQHPFLRLPTIGELQLSYGHCFRDQADPIAICLSSDRALVAP
jgi:hypothetical protein